MPPTRAEQAEPTPPPRPANTGVVPSGGMAGWQITLTAVGAALAGPTGAMLSDRARAARQTASATSV